MFVSLLTPLLPLSFLSPSPSRKTLQSTMGMCMCCFCCPIMTLADFCILPLTSAHFNKTRDPYNQTPVLPLTQKWIGAMSASFLLGFALYIFMSVKCSDLANGGYKFFPTQFDNSPCMSTANSNYASLGILISALWSFGFVGLLLTGYSYVSRRGGPADQTNKQGDTNTQAWQGSNDI